MDNSKIHFIRSLGYLEPHPDEELYSALMLQPRIVAGLTAVGVLLQTAWPFLAVSTALWWSALVPTRSLFDAIYNHGVARPRGLARLAAAPGPRRFAGGLAALVTLAIGVALVTDATSTAWALETLMVAAAAAVVFRRSCAGAELYFALCRRWSNGGCTATQPQ